MENITDLQLINQDLFTIKKFQRTFETVYSVNLTFKNGMNFEVEMKIFELDDSEFHKQLFYVHIDELTNFKSKYFVNWDNALNYAKTVLLHRSKTYLEFLKRKESTK